MTTAAHGPEARPSPSCKAPRPRALVIDDQAAIRDLLREILGLLGFEVDGAASGAEGLALFEQRAYDLVTTDLMMPGMTGWEVVEAIRRRAPGLGVIMVTGSASNLDTERAKEQAVTLLPKPFRLEELKGAVEQALRIRVSKEAPVIQEVAVEGLGDLRGAIDALRNVVAKFEAILGAVEVLIRERDELRARSAALERELQGLRDARDALARERQSAMATLIQLQTEHGATVRALGEVRERYQALLEDRERTADALQAIARRLRPDSDPSV